MAACLVVHRHERGQGSSILAVIPATGTFPRAHAKRIRKKEEKRPGFMSCDVIEVTEVDVEPWPIPRGPVVYMIQEGDTLSGIAERFDFYTGHPDPASVYAGAVELARINRISDPGHIEPGWIIAIPLKG